MFVALRGHGREHHDFPSQPFADLITAFEQDQTVTRYRNWDELFDYCRYSANPVGRLVLRSVRLSRCRAPALSDATCTALQLANFWQDVTVDLEKDRVYLPLDVLAQHGYTVEELFARQFDAALSRGDARSRGRGARAVSRRACRWPDTVDRRLALDLELFSRGGMRVLDKIEQQDYDVLARAAGDLESRARRTAARRSGARGILAGGMTHDARGVLRLLRAASRAPRPRISTTPSCCSRAQQREPCARSTPSCATATTSATSAGADRAQPSSAGARDLDDALGGPLRRASRLAGVSRRRAALSTSRTNISTT